MEGRETASGERAARVVPSPPVAALPAATLVLLRPGRRGIEVLLLRRPVTSGFAPDHWVFPGGRVDTEDRHLAPRGLAAGPPPAAWAAALGIDDPAEAAAYPIAAIRETFEETGILLIGSGVALPEAASVAAGRRQLLRGEVAFATLLQGWGVRAAAGDLRPVGHWITPDWSHRRFDTRFFATRVAGDALCTLEGDELAAFRWLRPVAALRAAARGAIRLLPPTIHTLRGLDESLFNP